MVGVKFVSRAGVFYRLMPEADYPNQRVALFRDTDNLRVQVLDTYFSLLRRPSNPLASLRLVTKDGSDSFVEQPHSRISTARSFGVDPCGSCVLCRQDRRRENE
jgi:hypothetical protein